MLYQELKLKYKAYNWLVEKSILLLFPYSLLATVPGRSDSVIACSSEKRQNSRTVSELLVVLHSHVWDMNSGALHVHKACTSIAGLCVRFLVLPAVHLSYISVEYTELSICFVGNRQD